MDVFFLLLPTGRRELNILDINKKEQEYDFYKDHKTEPWFIERYDPSQIFLWKS